MAGGRRDSCLQEGCRARAVEVADRCWGHAEEQELQPALRRLGDDGVLVARHVAFTTERLLLVLGALPRDAQGRPTVGRADFRGAKFSPEVSFDRVRFSGEIDFEDARFEGSASLDYCSFESTTWFTNTTFADNVTFDKATFAAHTWFERTDFDTATFAGVHFGADVSFQDAHFASRGAFEEVRFGADITFTGVKANAVTFDKVRFAAGTTFADVTVATEAGFANCVFAATRQLGTITTNTLNLGDSVWHERAVVEAIGNQVIVAGARFLSGIQLRIGRAELTLEGAELAAPSILTSPDTAPPRLVSLSRADVAGLVLWDVDLSVCEFAGAHHLNQLRVDNCILPITPAGWWRTRRHVIAEEARWRVQHSSTHRGRRAWQTSSKLEQPESLRPRSNLDAMQIAAIYRDLRKGREDAKDEPGAADFYYGEMEMRRLATSARHRRTSNRSAASAAGEHTILTLYWLVSGYGLRAWRALVGLSVLVVIAGLAFARWGIDDPDRTDLPNGLLVSARAAAAGLVDSDIALTTFGAWLQLSERLLGPVLVGVGLLAIRGRVRR